MKLRNLLEYKNIVVQCHDNPDADALASGWGVYLYLQSHGINVRFIYGGKFRVQKSNLVLMKDKFNIPVEYIRDLSELSINSSAPDDSSFTPDLLVCVDCQYGEGNVQRFDVPVIAVIDHHRVTAKSLITTIDPDLVEVRSNIGSCSTIVWALLQDEGFDIDAYSNLSTALYYGLMTDTSNFAEMTHPLDRDMHDELTFVKRDISLFRNSNLTLEELKLAGEAMDNCYNDQHYRYAIVEAKPCDPNLLGIISDALLEVDSVDVCIVYTILEFGIKMSLRSCVKETKASELASYIADGIGSGGGHIDKAGGFLNRRSIEDIGITYDSVNIRKMLRGLMDHYFADTQIIYAGSYDRDITDLRLYSKNRMKLGYVQGSDLTQVPANTNIRTLEGDVDTQIDNSVYIMIGIDGEIYPIKKSTFECSYEPSIEEYVYPGEYEPTIRNNVTGDSISIVQYAKSCYSSGEEAVYAQELDHRVKVFTSWDDDKYYLGVPGDFLVSKKDQPKDVYVVAREIFFKSYAPCSGAISLNKIASPY